MNRILTIWRQMTGAERAVAAAVALVLAVTVVAGAFALLKRPGDVSNPDADFSRKEGAGKDTQPKPQKTVNWTRFGYDVGRSKFLDTPRIRPPFRKVWKWKGDELIEFPPIVVDGRLYFIDNDGVYIALDAKTGKVIWKKQLASLNASSPAYFKGVLYSVSLSPAQALAVRARDGKVLWRKPLAARAESSPLVLSGRMYFGNEAGQFLALDIKDGSTIWETMLAGSVKAGPAFEDGTLYVGDYGGMMNAVRARDGKLLWQTSDLGTGIAGSGRFYSTPAVAFGRVYAGNADHRVYSFDADTGEIAWSFSTGHYVYSGVAAADTKGTGPTVYFGSHDRNVYAVDAKTGDEKWSEAAGGQISGPATVVGDVVYVSTFSGNATIGLDLGSGRRVFSYDDGEYGPVVSDAQKLYLTGGVSVVGFEPIDIGSFKYKTNKGQKGIVPPDQQRKALQAARERAREGGGGSANDAGGGQGGDSQGDQGSGANPGSGGPEGKQDRPRRGGGKKPKAKG
ncbi:MAG TPA: PQQ-binding-like beta-propeller repeat protein [Solirubrobacterales bacterium]|nr:PQQ-binding-like beta-propeller repeat protein [Solirubrobacterales bacterium]